MRPGWIGWRVRRYVGPWWATPDGPCGRHRGPLAVCVDDAALEIHNNDAERALRHVVTGRKNWMFFGCQKGGEVAARLFSLISSCKAMEINPETYLVDVIAAIDTTPASKIEVLTPWARAERC